MNQGVTVSKAQAFVRSLVEFENFDDSLEGELKRFGVARALKKLYPRLKPNTREGILKKAVRL